MSLRTGDVDRAFKKLGMEIREGKDTLAFFWYKGKLILTSRRSHGKGKIEGNIPNKIRNQLKLREDEFRDLVQCPLDFDGYVALLKKQGLITEERPAQ